MALLDDVLEEMKEETSESEASKETIPGKTEGQPVKPAHTYGPEFEEFAKKE